MIFIKVAIIGTRECKGLTAQQIVQYIPFNCSRIVSGGAIGVDKLAEEAAMIINVPIDIYKPDYESYGKLAPFKRNEIIASQCHMLLAFWDMKSRGTANILIFCMKHQVPFKIIPIGQG